MGDSAVTDTQLNAGFLPATPTISFEQKVGNVEAGDTIPKKKPQYSETTLIKSAQIASEKLTRPGEFIHVDNIIQEVYEPIPHRDVFYRIKRTMVSELIPRNVALRSECLYEAGSRIRSVFQLELARMPVFENGQSRIRCLSDRP